MTSGQIRFLTIAVICVLCSGRVDLAAAQTPASRTYYSYCYSEPLRLRPGEPSTTYFSAVFPTPDNRLAIVPPSLDPLTTGRPDGGVLAPGRVVWAKEFNEFLVQKYSYPTSFPVTCENQNTEQQAHEREDNLVRGERDNKRLAVETGWKFNYTPGQPIPLAVPCYTPPAQHRITSAPAGCSASETPPPSSAVSASPAPAPNPTRAPAAPAQPAQVAPATPPRSGATAQAAAAPQTLYAVCEGQTPTLPNGSSAFFSAPFEVTSRTANQAWAKSYRQVLTAKYGRIGAIQCKVLNSLTEAQKWSQQLMDRRRSTFKIVETGWKYE